MEANSQFHIPGKNSPWYPSDGMQCKNKNFPEILGLVLQTKNEQLN
jgi:hypothetical protein